MNDSLCSGKVVIRNDDPLSKWMVVRTVVKETNNYIWVIVNGKEPTKFSKRTQTEVGKKDKRAVVYHFTNWTPELQNQIDSEEKRQVAIDKVSAFLNSRFTDDELLRLHDLLPAEVYSLGRH
jgi:hypothetical protein